MASLVLFWTAVGLYALAGVLYFVNLLRFFDWTAPMSKLVMIGGFLAHIGVITAHALEGTHPAGSVREAVGFLAWVLVAAFLFAQLRRRLDAVGAFVAPAAVLLLLASGVAPHQQDMELMGILGRVHISLATVGVSIFALATGLAVLYLLEERQLKHKKFGPLVKHGTALVTLDTLSLRCVQIGFPIFTAAMITGAYWSAQRSFGLRPEYIMALAAWIAFGVLLMARVTAGWQGRRAAYITIGGFMAALVVVAIYLARAAI